MDFPLLLLALVVIALMSIVIMYAANAFEEAADWLGRDMRPGVKGATINAIGSSLPELFTTSIFLFGPLVLPSLFGSAEGGADHFSAGIATCAGSAVFNAVIIPSLCILAVTVYGVRAKDGTRRKVPPIELNKKTIIRDGTFFVLSELLLIWFLSGTTMVWWMGGALTIAYVVYISITLGFGFETGGGDEEETEEDDESAEPGVGILGLGWLCDLNARWFNNRPLTTGSAWTVLGGAVAVIAIACAGVVWGVERSAHALEIQPYFTAVILAAAATSVPDTVLSVKDAMKGQYDDAVANAVGSNIFDITICLGLPLFVYGVIVGDVSLQTDNSASADVQVLRWVLLIVTAGVLYILLVGKSIGRTKAFVLLSFYVMWTAFVIGRASDAGWANAIVELLPR